MSPWHLRQIARKIKQGALIAYPTDTVWGFGCHPLSFQAVQRINLLKQRVNKNGIILLASDIQYFCPYIDEHSFRRHYEKIATQHSTPTTWIIKASAGCPFWLTSNTQTIAIRITDKMLINELCGTLKSPLVSTSANIQGRSTARNGLLIHKNFKSNVDFIIEGFKTGSLAASSIQDLESGKILR